jgi:hypothetical protein
VLLSVFLCLHCDSHPQGSHRSLSDGEGRSLRYPRRSGHRQILCPHPLVFNFCALYVRPASYQRVANRRQRWQSLGNNMRLSTPIFCNRLAAMPGRLLAFGLATGGISWPDKAAQSIVPSDIENARSELAGSRRKSNKHKQEIRGGRAVATGQPIFGRT